MPVQCGSGNPAQRTTGPSGRGCPRRSRRRWPQRRSRRWDRWRKDQSTQQRTPEAGQGGMKVRQQVTYSSRHYRTVHVCAYPFATRRTLKAPVYLPPNGNCSRWPSYGTPRSCGFGHSGAGSMRTLAFSPTRQQCGRGWVGGMTALRAGARRTVWYPTWGPAQTERDEDSADALLVTQHAE